MKALIRTKAGKNFSSMEMQDISSDSPAADEVKVRMITSRVNPVDMDLMKGFPGLQYKNPQVGGVDGAGEIIEVGSNVSDLAKGDKVWFYRKFTDIGTWAEEVCIPALDVAPIPSNLSAQQAGGIALPALTAYESLLSLESKAGESILIHGAGGGVGFQALQMAIRMGLKVIANASERDRNKLEQAGISLFIDYKKQDFTEVLQGQVPDYIFDIIGKDNLMKSILLQPKKVVSIALPDTSKMHKTGVKLPWFLAGIMKLMNRKFIKAARKNRVELIGQVTGANGSNLAAAAKLIAERSYLVPETRTLSFNTLETQSLNEKDLGKVLIF